MRKRISMNTLSLGLFLIAAIIMAVFALEVRTANRKVGEQIKIEESRRLGEKESQVLDDASDYLTNEVWHYVANHREEHMANYWEEVNQTQRREKALQVLSGLFLTQEERTLIEDAKRQSDRLILGEAWAMRLIADSEGMELSQMPPEVAAVVYKDGEDKLSGPEKQALASGYIFGEEYTAVKNIIKEDISQFRQLLIERKVLDLDQTVAGIRKALYLSQLLMLALIAVFILEVIFLGFFILRPVNRYARALEGMKDSRFIPLSPEGGKETQAFAQVYNQIHSEWQQQQERLEEERNRFRIALENTSVVIYEYDAARDTCATFGSITEQNHSDMDKEQLLHSFLKEKAFRIFGEKGVDFFCGALSGGCAPAQLQIYPEPESSVPPVWVQITANPIFDGDRVVKLIGRITNIQSEKEKEIALEDAQTRDGLTGFYQKDVGIRLIRNYMESGHNGENCSLMLLDMDDFNRLNKEEGQVFADAVLQQAAGIVKAETTPGDILIRLGGDEFMLFIKNCGRADALLLGSRLTSGIRGLTPSQQPDKAISASIGECGTEVVADYSGLYRCAESALEYVKEHNKGSIACYAELSSEMGTHLTRMYPNRYKINRIERSEAVTQDLVSFALDLLGKAKNLEDAMYLLLNRVGNECRLDRILISELDSEYLSYRLVYQWTGKQEDRLLPEARYLTWKELKQLVSSYDDENLCERQALSSGKGNLESLLHSAIWNYGSYAGSMSFERHGKHPWSMEERKLLRELTRIISSFTLKARADAVNQAKTDFLSRMSHEIRTPMNAISGMTTIAKSTLGNPAQTMDCLNKIESANQYLLGLINDVLDMSRIESGKVEIKTAPVDLNAFIKKLDTMMRPQSEAKGLQLFAEPVSDGAMWVMADELRLNQVLINLLGNAVKFTEPGGSIRLCFRIVKKEKLSAQIFFSVIDTGIGISEEAKGRIFNAFEQAGSDTAASYGGTGLGLTISSRLVHMMGGVLDVESTPGKGSDFHFTLSLPYAPALKAPAETEKKSMPVSFRPEGIRLLLAEDNPLNREIALEILKMNGFTVEVAGNGREALEMFEAHEPGYYSAILMDVRMPVMNGLEATRCIRTLGRADSRTIPIIAMTADAFDEDRKRSLENGMDGHLSKPVNVDQLLNTLKELISRKN